MKMARANALRRDPLFKLAVERRPLDEAMDLASGPTFSRLENAVSTKDVDRMAQAFVDPFIASDPEAPEVIVIALDHSEDPTHGQQEFSFYNQYSQSHCDLPLFLFEGLSGTFITAALRPGKRPTGAENARIVKRVLQRLRAAWSDTHFLLRGDRHFANPELMALALADRHTDFLFGLAGNRVLSPLAKPFLEANRRRHAVREANARRLNQPLPNRTRSYHELEYAAGTWPQAFRVIFKAEVMAFDDHPRCVVTSLDLPSPACLDRDLDSARGQDENFIKVLKNDLASDRTSDQRFLANHRRLFFACGADVLHHARRTQGLIHTALAQAQPATVILKRFKIAVRVVQYQDRVKRQRPSNGPLKALLHRVTEIVFLTRPPDPLIT